MITFINSETPKYIKKIRKAKKIKGKSLTDKQTDIICRVYVFSGHLNHYTKFQQTVFDIK